MWIGRIVSGEIIGAVFRIVAVHYSGRARAIEAAGYFQSAAKGHHLWNGNQFDAPRDLWRRYGLQTRVIKVTVAVSGDEVIVLKINLAEKAVTSTAPRCPVCLNIS